MKTVTEDLRTRLFIGGEWRTAEGGGTFEVLDPSTGNPIARVEDAGPADALAAVEAAHRAQPAWAALAPRERAEILHGCYEVMTERAEELAALISLENGKALADARGEVAYAAEFFRWYSEEAVRVVGDLSVAPGGANRIMVQHQPVGVAVLVTPWNFPAAMATRKIAPALAAGCSVVLKPAAQTPLTAYAVADILHEVGVPAGVVNVLTTEDPGPVVSAMLHDPRVRALSFTGSTPVGRLLLREAADQVLKCSMELGGNAPFIVFDDADLDDALDGVMIAKMRNGGQACTAANRIYVQHGIREAFVRGLAERMGALVLGPGTDPGTQCGPLVDEAGVRKVERLVGEAVAAGASVVVGGERPQRDGYFYPPTVLDGVPPAAAMAREEVFGPVAGVIPFGTEDEVVAAANDTEHGLSAYVYTRDLARGLAVAERLESGMVAVNRGLVSDPAAPFGGVKQSGLGREGGGEGLREFTEQKYVAVAW
ncbi:NAD-dependent succinate-semialdehyde dehydrogenase [Streptomyces sp. TS71-3]|uniref:NAD-dependent succinate-semialdehyde dehydrogenase n=1 Tax=Streptomyces sp. TS71-3 TaxID=2733862 RepID=UPI001B18960B|nr:NAD-dependent succinate-semialdehyde dehydrogenase [Streptomyces sp. TS71-3]GHJ40916.1 NAD-dependent succinate-semialdehyde dehydrogenase [Streptomyces sp. TS71-3]